MIAATNRLRDYPTRIVYQREAKPVESSNRFEAWMLGLGFTVAGMAMWKAYELVCGVMAFVAGWVV